MSQSAQPGSRTSAYLRFIAGVVYFFAARAMASRVSFGLGGDAGSPVGSSLPVSSSLIEQLVLVFLLLVGYSSMGFWLDKQMHPITEQGLPRRRGWQREAGMGIAFGWSLALVPVLLIALTGGIATSFTWSVGNVLVWFACLAYFALATLAEELVCRGYAFQKLERAVGGLGAALIFAGFSALMAALVPGSTRSSILVAVVLSLALSAAYLRTRALWVGWGLHFAWNASRALVFGLAVSGVNSRSPIVQGNPMGSYWMTGGAFGLDASWMVFVVLLASLPVLFRLTADLDFLHNAPVLEPGGIAVDLDAAARAQHEAAMGPEQPQAPVLVQIQPLAGSAAPASPVSPPSPASASGGNPPPSVV